MCCRKRQISHETRVARTRTRSNHALSLSPNMLNSAPLGDVGRPYSSHGYAEGGAGGGAADASPPKLGGDTMDTTPHATQVEALPSHRGRHALSPHDLQAPLGGMMDRRLPLGRARSVVPRTRPLRGGPAVFAEKNNPKVANFAHTFVKQTNKQTSHPASRRTKLHLRQRISSY
jgi:hypothetical protein